MGYEGTQPELRVNPTKDWFLKDGKLPEFHNEVEAKIMDARIEDYRHGLDARGMKRLDPVTLFTIWYDKGPALPSGVSARVRIARTESGKEQYFAAIKIKPKDRAVSKSELTSLRYECEWETNNLATAQAELALAVRHLYPGHTLSFDLGTTMTKRRVTYVSTESDNACAQVRFDFDEIIEYGDIPLNPIAILEIESFDESSILKCAEDVGISRDKLALRGSTHERISAQLLSKVFRESGL